ncbi:hypothetical protein A5821_003034 [Enterococcus sp. 7F3_DIV0205]|uniref:WxL domain-containing protein n=1 Tax=Candidatus Enterococcus palustris TaxID=1834189 RepID=A0AAQ3WC35_9ENTE|nr:WxL domain-containing protein [Enterococcus sp. 7F3_DIV0205]OTN83468.1 hypothetical protein A5821_003391 [Enterococcus sp. 7F3_DIV0205]
MKKVTLLTATLIAATLLGAQSAQAEETVYPVKAQSDATVTLIGDDGEGGNTTGPGGGTEGGNGGEITPPGGGEGGEGGVVDPGQNSSLRLSLLTAFDFGTIKMSGNTETYTAKLPTPNFIDGGKQDRPNFIQVTDNRGNLAGWNVTAKIAEQFTNGETTLNGSYITLDNGWTQPQTEDNAVYAPTVTSGSVTLATGADAPIATASADKGMGTWNIMYGTLFAPEKETLGDAANSVHLTIPGNIKKTEGSYTAKIQWTLSDAPAS